MIYPYIRTQIGALVTAGGFYLPPLQPLNFEGIFRQRLAEAQEQGVTDGPVEH